MDRKAALEAAILRLTPNQFTRSGKPSVDDINDHLERDGYEPITAAERDELWAERVAEAAASEAMDAGAAPIADDAPDEAPALEDAPEGTVRLKITAAPCSPVPLYVHGVGRFSLRVGATCTLPIEALDALRNSDCTFTEE